MKSARRTARPEVSFGEACDPGLKREENQDSVLHGTTPQGELFVISDGVGGYVGGAEASKIVTSGMLRHLASLGSATSPEAALAESGRRVNAEVYAAGQSGEASRRRMSATLVVALLMRQEAGFEALIGNVGDSRAYLLRAGKMIQLTIDHTAVQAMLDSGVLTPEQAANHPRTGVLTRTIGQAPDVRIDMKRVRLLAGDQLLLCSDGLHSYVDASEIAATMANPRSSAADCSQALLGLALAAGGPDNIGIQVVRLSPAPFAAGAPPGWRKNPIKIAAIAACAILAANAGGLRLYEVWQARPTSSSISAPAASVDSHPAGIGEPGPPSGVDLPGKEPASGAGADATMPSKVATAPAASQLPPLHVGGLTPSTEAERTWYRELGSRWEPINEVDALHNRPCQLLDREVPIAYYRNDAIRSRPAANDPELEKHYTFMPYSTAVRDACGEYDLLLLPARTPILPESVKNKASAARDKAKAAEQTTLEALKGRTAPNHPAPNHAAPGPRE